MIDDNWPCVIACQGPPRCELTGDAAHVAIVIGCPWCERHYVKPDGKVEIVKPGEA